MPLPRAIDPDLLRSFTCIAEEGSFTRAAARVGRTQAAVSMQMRRLEELLGVRVLVRSKGGSVGLTAHGRFLLDRARAMLAANDGIWNAFREPEVAGTVRLGTPDDYALRWLPPILRGFADSHPAVEVEVVCMESEELVARLRAGELDLTLASEGAQPRGWPALELWRGPLGWVTAEGAAPHGVPPQRMDPIPLALAHDDGRSAQCVSWRRAALDALDGAGRRWRVAYTSGTQIGTHAPVLAGLAITVSALAWLPAGLRALRPDEGLPALPDFSIVLLQAENPAQPVTSALARHIAASFGVAPAG
jgi:DNA-binding transcriptional LysR family regulator